MTQKKSPFEFSHPVYRPVWVRALIVGATGAWAGLEYWLDNIYWAAVFLFIAIFAFWGLFISYDFTDETDDQR